MLREITRYPDRFIKVTKPCVHRRVLELSGRTEVPSRVPFDEIRAPLVECIFSSRGLVGTPSELYLRENGFVLSAAFTKGPDDAPQLFNWTAGYRDKPIRPRADPAGRFRCHRGTDEPGSSFWPRVELGFFDDDPAAMRHGFAGP
jgi:hypothetical protein